MRLALEYVKLGGTVISCIIIKPLTAVHTLGLLLLTGTNFNGLGRI